MLHKAVPSGTQRDDQKENEHSSNSLEGKGTKLTAISEEPDDELLEWWMISDVLFSGLVNGSSI